MARRGLIQAGIATVAALVGIGGVVVTGSSASAVEPTLGVVYLSPAEVSAIKASIADGNHPDAAAQYDDLISDANKALNAGPFSVTKNGGRNGSHVYTTDSPYCWKYQGTKCVDRRDGQVNPNADRKDYTEAINFGHAVRDLGLAYGFTNDSRYASKAVSLIKAWTYDSSTRMEPRTIELQSDIELSITIPGMFYGASFLEGYTDWDATQKQAFVDWSHDMADSIYNSSAGESNNILSWRTNLVATAGAVIGDSGLRDEAFNRFKSSMPSQINSTGQMVKELSRADSLSYSLYAMNAMTQTAEVAQHYGVDLYGYTSSGRGLKTALDYHATYCLNPGSWTAGDQNATLDKSSCASYEIAYKHFGSDSYLQVLDKYRPLEETRIMGPVTLTSATS